MIEPDHRHHSKTSKCKLHDIGTRTGRTLICALQGMATEINEQDALKLFAKLQLPEQKLKYAVLLGNPVRVAHHGHLLKPCFLNRETAHAKKVRASLAAVLAEAQIDDSCTKAQGTLLLAAANKVSCAACCTEVECTRPYHNESWVQYPVEALSQRQRFLQEYIVREKLAVRAPSNWSLSPNCTLILHVNAVSRSSTAHLLQCLCRCFHIGSCMYPVLAGECGRGLRPLLLQTSKQLDAAFVHLKSTGDQPYESAQLDAACGVGVMVRPLVLWMFV